MSNLSSSSFVNKGLIESQHLVSRDDKPRASFAIAILSVLAFSILLLMGIALVLVGYNVIAAPLGLLISGCAASVCSMIAIISLFFLYKRAGTSIPFSKEKTQPVEAKSLLKNPEITSLKPPKTPLLSEDDFKPQVIESTFYHQNKVYSKPIAERMQSLEKEIKSLIIDFPLALKESIKSSGSLFSGISSEVKNLFLPRFLARKPKHSLCACLKRLGAMVEEHACSDLLILFLTKPELASAVVRQLIAHAVSLKNEKQGLASRMQKLVLSINFWFYGWFLEEKSIEKIIAYNPNLLTDELKAYLEQGNVVQFLLSQQTPELQGEFRALFPKNAQEIPGAKEGNNYFSAMNSSAYMYDWKEIRVIKQAFNERLAFCEGVASPSSWNFSASLATHYNDLTLLSEFCKNQQSVIFENPFLLIELFNGKPKYQKFLKGLLEKAMPMSSWAALLRPMLTGMLTSGIARKKELKIIAERAGVSFQDLTEAIGSGKILDLLLQHLFYL
ncbi:CT214 family putative inclusion membrane protein [Candidatus Chlamydia corallus]|uniref:CT214 family putative inclusion membrane protein n=1 Tax=Candidatus Chlamydia corallus TaxID=2038470 RepID=UPI001EFDB5F7|nr:hypothetical protein [Candidatus Chlamydia corallus]